MKKSNITNYKKTLSKFTTGITVVCFRKNKKIYGKTINSFNALSLKPQLVLFSLGNYSSNFENFFNNNFLSINILSKNQKNISNNFSMKSPKTNIVKFFETDNHIPLIDGCIANLECKIEDKIKKGDHTIFICKVISVQFNNKLEPLNYFNSKYL